MSRISGAEPVADFADLRLPFPRLPFPRLLLPRLTVAWPPFPRLTVIPPFLSLTWRPLASPDTQPRITAATGSAA